MLPFLCWGLMVLAPLLLLLGAACAASLLSPTFLAVRTAQRRGWQVMGEARTQVWGRF